MSQTLKEGQAFPLHLAGKHGEEVPGKSRVDRRFWCGGLLSAVTSGPDLEGRCLDHQATGLVWAVGSFGKKKNRPNYVRGNHLSMKQTFIRGLPRARPRAEQWGRGRGE